MTQIHSMFPQTPIRNMTPLRHQRYNSSVSPNTPIFCEQDGVIYGTTIVLKKAMFEIQKFLMQFIQHKQQQGQVIAQYTYKAQLSSLISQSTYLFEVQGTHIKQFNQELYYQLLYFPAQMISCFDLVIKQIFHKHFLQEETEATQRNSRMLQKQYLMMNLKGIHRDDKLSVKQLSPSLIDRLVMIQAIVIRVSQVYPQMKRAWFQCQYCGDQLGIDLQNARVQQPDKCRICRKQGTLQLIHNLCSFTDKQYIKFQELPQNVADSQTPFTMTAIVYDQNVDGFRPGDRIQLIGIYRPQQMKSNNHKSIIKTVFNTYIDTVSFNILQQSKNRVDQENTKFSDYQIRQFHKFAQSNDVVNKLIKSFAPSIYSNDDVKKGLLTQIFGGTVKHIQNRGRFRSDINICLVGDPSTAKSQFLQQVSKIASRCIYTSGKGSSAIGLTANVRKDPQTHEFVLQSGALVLADKGICCIDEFDKMDQQSRVILLQAMEQQTISIAKAGIVCQLNSRTAILAAANPKNSKYDTTKSIVQNINLKDALLSRFDLIYILLDMPNQINDTMLATHILQFFMNKEARKPVLPPLSATKLAKYITYARQFVHPIITQQSGQRLINAYKDMRLIGQSKNTITATPRQLQSLIRISQALAKMKLSNVVTVDDVEEAVNLVEKAMLSIATDPQTGVINMDIITTGRSAAIQKRNRELADKIRQVLFENQSKYIKTTNVQKFKSQFEYLYPKMTVQVEQLEQALKIIQSQDLISLFNKNRQFKLQSSKCL